MQSDFGKLKVICMILMISPANWCYFCLGRVGVVTRNSEGNLTISEIYSFFAPLGGAQVICNPDNFLGKISLEHYYFRLLKFDSCQEKYDLQVEGYNSYWKGTSLHSRILEGWCQSLSLRLAKVPNWIDSNFISLSKLYHCMHDGLGWSCTV